MRPPLLTGPAAEIRLAPRSLGQKHWQVLALHTPMEQPAFLQLLSHRVLPCGRQFKHAQPPLLHWPGKHVVARQELLHAALSHAASASPASGATLHEELPGTHVAPPLPPALEELLVTPVPPVPAGEPLAEVEELEELEEPAELPPLAEDAGVPPS